MQSPETTKEVPVQKENGAVTVPIYDVGVKELQRVSSDDAARRQVDADLNEARGRDGARLHVTLKAITEADRRAGERTARTVGAVEALEEATQRRLEALSAELTETRASLSHQIEATLQSVNAQAQESSDRLAVDVRKLRDELVSLVDSRMNQADASFAAIRGDVEVVKYLVMDLIKDRIGRAEPRTKTL